MDTVLSTVFYLTVLTALSVFIIKTTKTYWIDPNSDEGKEITKDL